MNFSYSSRHRWYASKLVKRQNEILAHPVVKLYLIIRYLALTLQYNCVITCTFIINTALVLTPFGYF